MLEDGASLSTVRRATGISETTASFLRKEKVLPREQVEAVKRSLQDKFALVASQALESIDSGKLHEAGFGELVRGAALAADRAGISQLSAVDQLVDALSKYQKSTPKPAMPEQEGVIVNASPPLLPSEPALLPLTEELAD
jgi:hypothetical protein